MLNSMSEGIFRIYHTEKFILIHNLVRSKVISIDKCYCSINSQDISFLNNAVINNVHKAHGILGIIEIGMYDFLTYIKNTTKVGNIGNTEIFEVKEVECILIFSERELKLPNEIVAILNNIKSLLSQGFYYSHNYDLTNSLQNQKIIKINNNNKYDFMKDSNPEFLWNHQIYAKFFDYNVDSDFLVNCIFGYIGTYTEKIQDNTYLNYILISRRSTQNAGLKSLKKGMDSDGNVANFVETEQILIVNQNVFSYVQVRGSPPVFYQNVKYSSKEYSELPELFERHVQQILRNKNYKLLFIINLMNSLKENEHALTDTYEKLIQQKNLKNLKYCYFDFDNEVNNPSYNSYTYKPSTHSVDDILELFNKNTNVKEETNNSNKKVNQIEVFLCKMENIFSIFKFFGIFFTYTNEDANLLGDINNNNRVPTKVIYDQVGIIRTNCYDGVDRTNTLQMRVGWKVLLNQLECIGLDGNNLFGSINNNDNNDNANLNDNIIRKEDENISFLKEIFNDNQSGNTNGNANNTETRPQTLVNNYKRLWSENNDKLAFQYVGSSYISQTTKEDMSKFCNLTDDNLKQRCIDILLKKYNVKLKSSKYNIKINLVNDEVLKKELDNQIDKYTITQDLTIFIGSWNVGGQNLKDEISLFEWLYPKNKLKKTPDIYCIGLQEIVELNANYLLISSNQHRVDYWRNNIKNNLDAVDSYTCVKCLDLIGVFIVLFVKSSIKDTIKNLDHVIIKTGLMGAMGNKGSCLIRFNILDTSFAFSSGHFAAGSSANASRLNELGEILNKNFPLYKDLKFRDHNVMFVFGDLNFRVDIEYNTCLSLIKSRNIPQLLQYDQFLKNKDINFNLTDLEEGDIYFQPTYKYVVGSQEYDSKRKRVPSFCDRILFKKDKRLHQVAYDRAEYTHSDHRPIYSIFNVQAVKEMREKKHHLIKEIKQNMLLGINSNCNPNPFQKKLSSGITEEENKGKRFDNKFYLTKETEDKKEDNEILNFFK